MKEFVRRILVKTILSSDYLFKVLRVLLTDYRVYDKLLADDYLLNRFANDKRLLDEQSLLPKILGNDDLLSKVLQDKRALQQILSDSGLLAQVLQDKRALQQILSDSGLLAQVLQDKRALQQILGNDDLLSKVLQDKRALQQILGNDDLLSKVLQDKRALQQILGNDDLLLSKVLQDKRALQQILGNDDLLSKVLQDKRALQQILGNDDLLSKVLQDKRALQQILGNHDLLSKLLNDNRALQHVLNQEQPLEKILLNPQTHDRILINVRILDRLLLDTRTIERVFLDGRVLDRILLDSRTTEKIVSDSRILDRILLDARTVENVLTNLRVMNSSRFYDRLATAFELQQSWQTLTPFVLANSNNRKYQIALEKACSGNKDVQRLILDVLCNGNEISLAHGIIKFSDQRALWILLHEVLVNEDYYFETKTDSPTILDCGTNFGLTLYYFKTLYPKAKIIGFEPMPAMRDLAIENITRNNYQNVEVLPYALADEDGTSTFVLSNTDSMAGSLTDRRRGMGDEVTEIDVECRRLSTFLQEPIHFLKLDIEGVEDLVLAEAEAYLSNVQHIVCEYHHGSGLDTDRLGKILLLLDRAGFDTHVSKAMNFRNQTSQQPMNYVHRFYSALIWAKNRNWAYF